MFLRLFLSFFLSILANMFYLIPYVVRRPFWLMYRGYCLRLPEVLDSTLWGLLSELPICIAGIAQLGEQQTEASCDAFWRSRVQSTVLALLRCTLISDKPKPFFMIFFLSFALSSEPLSPESRILITYETSVNFFYHNCGLSLW